MRGQVELTAPSKLKREAIAMWRRWREFRAVMKGLASTRHPVVAHIIPIRRCNLACAYCNEYDDFSPPVPAGEMLRRIDRLAGLGLTILTFSGGEPMLHPDLDVLIRRTRRHGIVCGLITNGFLLNVDRIRKLNNAGLDHLQISIDNVEPDDISFKSLKTLDHRLRMLAAHAEFHVSINSVFGAGVRNPEDALRIGKRAIELGFTSTIGVIHDQDGQLKPLQGRELEFYEQLRNLDKRSWGRINRHNPFQKNLVAGRPNNWWYCRAGARYLYVCEDGLVHYCSQQRGYPGIPLERYTLEDIRREYLTKKECAPYCTISCVHQTSIMDRWRDPQVFEFAPERRELVQITGSGKP